MSKYFVAACLAVMLAGCADTTSNKQKLQGESTGTEKGAASCKYTCTMHPKVCSDKPGVCPKCGMDLVEKD